MRNLTVSAQAAAAQRQGSEPLNIIKIDWNTTTSTLYCDRDYLGIPGQISTLGNLDIAVDVSSGGNVGNVQVKLIDPDGQLKLLMDTYDIHKKPCTIYQLWDGLTMADAVVLFQGVIYTPITWSEGERTITFDVVNQVHNQEVGFTPDEGQFANIPDALAGHAWPLGFGDVVHVPAVKIGQTLTGTTAAAVWVPDYTLPWKQQYLLKRIEKYNEAYLYYIQMMQYASELARLPEYVEADYIDVILFEDDIKQQVETKSDDLGTLEKKIKKLKDSLEHAKDLGINELIESTETEISEQQEQLDELREEVLELTNSLKAAKAEKEILEIETDNAEYGFRTYVQIGKRVNTIIENYYRTLIDLYKLNVAINEQYRIQSFLVPIVGGEKFPRGYIQLVINGMIAYGYFVGLGNVFQMVDIQPRYFSIPVAPRETNDYNAFWVTDSAVNLKGHYCLLLNGKIIRVLDQIGRKCIVQLIEKQTDNRWQNDLSDPIQQGDLQEETWSALQEAQEYTTKQRKRILLDSIENEEDEGSLTSMQEKIKTLQEKIKELAPNTDDYIAVQQAIYSDMKAFNSRISTMKFPENDVAKADRKISEEEFRTILRLENLANAIDNIIQFPPQPDIPDFSNGIFYATGYDVYNVILAASVFIPPAWLNLLPPGQTLRPLTDVLQLPDGRAIEVSRIPETTLWVAQAGTEVTLPSLYQNKYVVNIAPSTIRAVYAYRGIGGFRRLVPVPLQYYVKNEADPYGPITATTISLVKPLSQYDGEDWSDEIFVTYSSSIGSNTCDIIQYLCETYSDLSIDSTSFADVRAKVDPFPMNFAIFDKQNVLDMIKEIARQARCSLIIKEGVVYIRYLAETPTPITTITEDNIVNGSLNVSLTQTEDVYTKFTNTYKPSYDVTGPTKIILRHNVNKYGVVERTTDYWCYNIHDIVLKAATFWMIRETNSWKQVQFKLILDKIILETFDVVTLDFDAPYISSGPVIGIIQKADYDSDSSTLDVTVWTPVRSGSLTAYDYAFPASLDSQTVFPSFNDIAAGNAGNPFNQTVPSGQGYHVHDLNEVFETIDLRPKDFGEVFPSDQDWVTPASPIEGYSEVELELYRIEEFKMTIEEPLANKNDATILYSVTDERRYDGRINDRPFIATIIDYEGDDLYLIQRPDGEELSAKCLTTFEPELDNGTSVVVVVSQSTGGYEFDYNKQKSTTTKAILISIEQDYLVCEGQDEEIILIAKPYQLRVSPFNGETYGGIQYSYQDSTHRQALAEGDNDSNNSESQIIIPRYIAGDLIYATYIFNGTDVTVRGTELKWVDMNVDGRAWSQIQSDD